MKKIESDEPRNWGCPTTEQRTRAEEFALAPESTGLNLKFNNNGPHYQSDKTRIAFSEWEKKNPA